MPGRNFNHRVISAVPVDHAWQALQKPDTWGRIGGVNKIESPTFDNGGNLTGYGFVVDIAGAPYRGMARRTEWAPPHRMTMAINSEQLIGRITVELAPSDIGTEVRVSMGMEPAGLFGSMFFPIVANAVSKEFPGAVERFVTDLAS